MKEKYQITKTSKSSPINIPQKRRQNHVIVAATKIKFNPKTSYGLKTVFQFHQKNIIRNRHGNNQNTKMTFST